MARSVEFKLNDEQITSLHEALNRATGNKEERINTYLHQTASKAAVLSLTKYIPLSKSGKKHAKNLVWYKVTPLNLAFKIETKSPFYYLWFVNEGSGTSKKRGGSPFVSLGADAVQNDIFNGVLDAVIKTYEEELNHV